MRVLLGITGSIAAYKSVEVLRGLQRHRVEVEVLLTRSARRFLTPLTFSSLTGKPVLTSLWNAAPTGDPDASIEHIALAQAIDALLVAPATATTLARLAHGLCTDLLSTLYLATSAPVLIAPAMNVVMWQHPATQANLDLLRQRGARIVEPESGQLACGMEGSGRLATPEVIVAETLQLLRSQDLSGETVLITAGGTREALDPVRFLGNRSSGRMGHALAAAARDRGAHVILITASALPAPAGVLSIPVESTGQMQNALQQQLPRATMVYAAAAVADFRPASRSPSKLRRQGPLTLHLEPTPDLLAGAVAQRRPGTLVIGFAAEMGDLEQNGRCKLERKGADAIVANDISVPGLGFDADSNAGLFLTRNATTCLPVTSKRAMADRILTLALELRDR